PPPSTLFPYTTLFRSVVEGLHDADALTLLDRVLHQPVDVRVRERIVAETRGNPLALVEWPRDLTPAELAGGFGLPALLPMLGQIDRKSTRLNSSHVEI